ncbi:MAG: MgtC/SapB family protein [Candidatus Magasanikbacteria bacterium]|nr:MgtC/SapB family protein [Candidatus Magasanikbacteria bacterium]
MDYILFFGHILLAAILGGLIGWQRRHMGKSAGFRTFALVSIGSTLFTILSLNAFSADPARVASQVLTGIGFIGAGIIFHKKDSVEGLTTAASFWSVAAIGMAVGAGWYIESIIVTLVVFLVLASLVKKK